MYLVLRVDINKSRKFLKWELFLNTWVVMLLTRDPNQIDQLEWFINHGPFFRLRPLSQYMAQAY